MNPALREGRSSKKRGRDCRNRANGLVIDNDV